VAWAGNFHKPVAESVADYTLRGVGTAEPGMTAYATNALFTVKFFDGEYDNAGEQVWNTVPSEKTVRVQVTLNNAMSMLDDEVYSIMFKNQRVNAAANSTETLQKVIVKIKKVLPTTVPELIVKKGQEKNILPLKVHMKPVVNYPAAPWVTVATPYASWNLKNADNVVYGQDIKPFDYADIFTNLQTPLFPFVDKSNYSFEIENSDLKDENEYVSTFAKYGVMDLAKNRNNLPALVANTYTTPYAYSDRIGTAAKKVIVHYTYPNLSLTEENQRPHYEDVKVKEDYSKKFTVSYICALRLNNDFVKPTTQALWPAMVAATAANDAAAKAAAKTEWENLWTVNYEDNTHDIPFTALYYNVNGVGSDELGLTGTTYATRADLPQKAYISEMLGWNILRIADVSIDNEDYFTARLIDGAGNPITGTAVPAAVQLVKTRSTEEPALTSDVKFNMSITLEDVFGHQHKVTQAITMKKPVLKARGL
jgi:hypothetical protein